MARVNRRYPSGALGARARARAADWRVTTAVVVAFAAAGVVASSTTATAANRASGTGPSGFASLRHRTTSTTTTTTSSTTTTPTTTTLVSSGASNPAVELVPLYEYAGNSTLAGDWATACAGADIVVANGASSGPPTSNDSDWPDEEGDLAPAMASCYPHGSVQGEAIGYIDTADGSTAVSTVEQDMQEWISFDPSIAGFFFDEANSSSSGPNESYYESITSAARADGRDVVVWNWGADAETTSWPFQAGQSFATSWPSYVVVFEGSSSSFQNWAPAQWEAGSWSNGPTTGPYSNSLAAIVYNTPSSSVSGVCSVIDRLWSVSGSLFGYYLTNENLPNPYAGLDEYNAAEVSDC
jgi:hypothetical protein